MRLHLWLPIIFSLFLGPALARAEIGVIVGITEPGQGLGVLGHAVIGVGDIDAGVFNVEVYSYFAQVDRQEQVAVSAFKSLLASPPLGVDKGSLNSYLGQMTIGHNRSTYLFRVRMPAEAAAALKKRIENEFNEISSGVGPRYSANESCWTHIARLLNEHLSPDQRIEIPELKFDNVIFPSFDRKDVNMLDLTPYYFLTELRKNKGLFRELPAFTAAGSRKTRLLVDLIALSSESTTLCGYRLQTAKALRFHMAYLVQTEQFEMLVHFITDLKRKCPRAVELADMAVSDLFKFVRSLDAKRYDSLMRLVEGENL